MKVLYIQDSLGTGGAERSNAELWYYLRQQNVKIKIVVLEHRKEGVEKEILNAGFDVDFLETSSFFNQVKQIKNIVQEFQPDVVHSVLFRAALRTRFVKQLVNLKNVESLVNCSYAEVRYKDPNVKAAGLKFYEKLDQVTQSFGVDHFIAITDEVKKHYKKHLKIKEDRISVIYRGRRKNEFLERKNEIRNSLCEELNLDPDGKIFIHVGRQEFQKAHIDLVQAIHLADDELSQEKAQFLFCGRKGSATPKIEKFLEEHKLQTPVKFLGHRNDIYQLLVAADVFVFPSLYEGLGGSLIEAQAAGLPVICSDIPVFREVVTSENAYFHKKNDPRSLSEQLKAILQHGHLQTMSKKSLENYEKKFQLELINKQMLEKYQELSK